MAKTRLGISYEALSGRLGNTVASNEQDGTSIRAYNPVSKQPFTPAQLAAEADFTKANQTWPSLDPEIAQTFKDYALTQRVKNPLTGKYRTRNGKDVFVGLYAKLLQISSTSALPQIPTGTYSLPGLSISISLQGNEATFRGSASTPNDTRLIAWGQRLPSRNATPTPDGYKTLIVGSLEAGDANELTTTLAPGYWCFGTTFASAVTGQETAMVVYPVQTVTLAVEQGGVSEGSKPVRAAKKAA